MSVKNELDRLKKAYEEIKNDDEAKAIFEEAKQIIDGFLAKGDDDIESKLTGYADVDETLVLTSKGAKVRKAYVARVKAIHFLTSALQLISKYTPVLNEAVDAAKELTKSAKSAAKKSLSRRKKK